MSPQQKFSILQKGMKIITSIKEITPYDLLDKDYGEPSSLLRDKSSPNDLFGGYPAAKFMVNDPDQVKEVTSQNNQNSEDKTMSTLQRVIGNDPKRIQLMKEAQLLHDAPEIDTCMGVDQIPILMQLLKREESRPA